MEGVLVKSNFGFYVGHKVAAFLQNYFLMHDGTITSFIRALKVSKFYMMNCPSFSFAFYIMWGKLSHLFVHSNWIWHTFMRMQIARVKHFAMEPLSFLGKGIFDEDSQVLRLIHFACFYYLIMSFLIVTVLVSRKDILSYAYIHISHFYTYS